MFKPQQLPQKVSWQLDTRSLHDIWSRASQHCRPQVRCGRNPSPAFPASAVPRVVFGLGTGRLHIRAGSSVGDGPRRGWRVSTEAHHELMECQKKKSRES